MVSIVFTLHYPSFSNLLIVDFYYLQISHTPTIASVQHSKEGSMSRSRSNLELLDHINTVEHCKKIRMSKPARHQQATLVGVSTSACNALDHRPAGDFPEVCAENMHNRQIENTGTSLTDVLELLEKLLPPVFCRSQVKSLTLGMVNPRTLANRDSLGTGPAGRFTIGRQVWYRKEPFLVYFSDLIRAK